ncbi:hypothetical protein AMS68_003260 [Peltaster fructicola]|uniref:HMG box domain-containing protein n=1 Tax=Peltaster fructicola TaxID=286661 RepID=A0A6H0XSP4_9PEZI|nr:hypothetical protein AMS68_003260 [Peltaster fructicola]
MPTEAPEVPASRREQTLESAETSSSSARIDVDADRSRRTSSTVSSRSIRPPKSPTAESRTPLTPEESPPYRSTRKRAISNVEDDDRAYHSVEPSPTHSRTNSSEQAAVQVCICQPEPKIPRPRNAFILYRQHHQAKVIAEHPGLANPEISKIIGEQWRNQPADVKNEWKRLAEEEKVRHQQQYPSYRYQPRRHTRRGSLIESSASASTTSEKSRCSKCGGRTILPPSTYAGPSQGAGSASSSSLQPSTPNSTNTPSSRTLPILGDLSLQSPGARRMGRPFSAVEMSPRHAEERDDGPQSPDSKRRRFNNEQPMFMYRAVPPRYAIATGPPMNPGTPYPFPPGQHPQLYPTTQSASHARRESLPSLRMMDAPGPMAPPPRPGPGYHQHRLSQGHIPPDRSLILPPLQTGIQAPTTSSSKSSETRSARDVIMGMPLSEKLEVLRRIAPPARLTNAAARGPLIAIEGDSHDAVQGLGRWLVDMLGREDELDVKAIDSPEVAAKCDDDSSMAQYHILAADWLTKSKTIIDELSYVQPTPPNTGSAMSLDSIGSDSKLSSEQKDNQKEANTKLTQDPREDQGGRGETSHAQETRSHFTDAMVTEPAEATKMRTQKPVLVIPAFSLHATNVFSCRIPITDVYSPKEHWQWSATLWRGIVGPDLTIYLRDTDAEDSSRTVEQSEAERLFVVKRNKTEASNELDIDSTTLRRLGFEVSEWVRAHGTKVKA